MWPARLEFASWNRGRCRVAVEVRRASQGSTIVQTIRLSAGEAGNRVEFDTHIDWHTPASDLKATFPLAVSNPLATYNWEAGTIHAATTTRRNTKCHRISGLI